MDVGSRVKSNEPSKLVLLRFIHPRAGGRKVKHIAPLSRLSKSDKTLGELFEGYISSEFV